MYIWSTWCYAGIKLTLVHIFVHVSSTGLYNKADSGKYAPNEILCWCVACTTEQPAELESWTCDSKSQKPKCWGLLLPGWSGPEKDYCNMQWIEKHWVEVTSLFFFFFFTNLTVLIGNSSLLFIVAYRHYKHLLYLSYYSVGMKSGIPNALLQS